MGLCGTKVGRCVWFGYNTQMGIGCVGCRFDRLVVFPMMNFDAAEASSMP